MPTSGARVNRGPAAAPGNRQAVLTAARSLFSEQGYRVPLSLVAREAGVGQGVLYRHFPTRLHLALAVFEENFLELEAIAGEAGTGVFARLWSRVIDLTVETSAFVEMVVDARRAVSGYDGDERLRALFARTLDSDQGAGAPTGLTPDDVMLAWRMIYGVVVTAVDPADVREAVTRTHALLGMS